VILISLRRENLRTIVSVAGRLDEGYLAELQEQCRAIKTELVFDLSELKTADRAAVHWLVERQARGEEILGASPYIKILLERDEQRTDPLTAKTGSGAGEDGE